MFKTTILKFAVLVACLSILSATASADTKVTSRQTSGGQTYENTSYIKGKRQRSETNNGQMVMIQQCDLRRNIQIMTQMKVYMIQPYDQPSTPSTTPNNTTPTTSQPVTKGGVVTSTVTTKDTGERKQMFGYTARHIITTMETKSSPDACNAKQYEDADRWLVHRCCFRARLRQQSCIHKLQTESERWLPGSLRDEDDWRGEEGLSGMGKDDDVWPDRR